MCLFQFWFPQGICLEVELLGHMVVLSFAGGSDGRESACNAEDLGLIPGSRRFPKKREWLPTPIFLPGDFHGQRSLVSYSPKGYKESDMTE